MTTREQLQPGTLVGGRYRLDHLIGMGGMGAVYRATQADLGRKVAVKILLPQFRADPAVIERFHQEAQLAASIGHDNICEVTDFGTGEDGIPFLVMPLLRGESLAAVMKRDIVGHRRMCDILRQVLLALHAAHVAGVVHRDLKPDNIFLLQMGDRKDFVKLLDFGVSKVMEGETARRLTLTGTVLGTPFYMAPEQARGADDLDHRIDIYAAGVILYEALTRKRPYDGDSYNDIVLKIALEPCPPPRQVDPRIPEHFESVVLKAMARKPSERYVDAKEMAEALDRALGVSSSLPRKAAAENRHPGSPQGRAPIEKTRSKSSRRKRNRLIYAVAAAISLFVVAGLFTMRAPEEARRISFVPASARTSPPAPIPAAEPSPPPPVTATSDDPPGLPATEPEAAPFEKPTTQAATPSRKSTSKADAPSRSKRNKRTLDRQSSTDPEPAPEPAPAVDPLPPKAEPAIEAKSPTPDLSTYTNMNQLKSALREGKITRAQYAARQAELKRQRAAEYEQLKGDYRAGHITKSEYEQRVRQVRRKYEGD